MSHTFRKGLLTSLTIHFGTICYEEGCMSGWKRSGWWYSYDIHTHMNVLECPDVECKDVWSFIRYQHLQLIKKYNDSEFPIGLIVSWCNLRSAHWIEIKPGRQQNLETGNIELLLYSGFSYHEKQQALVVWSPLRLKESHSKVSNARVT